MNLSALAFRRADESRDDFFYEQARFVTHIEPPTIESVAQLYRELLTPQTDVLDLMSSWVSHLPPELELRRVAGLGMNDDELRANPRLTDCAVHHLNANPTLPYEDEAFDAALCCVSVQYLTQPVEVMREVLRVCRPDAPFIVTFSNRCFPTKAVFAWQSLDDAGHLQLVAAYLREAGWQDVQMLDRTAPRAPEPLLAVVGRKE